MAFARSGLLLRSGAGRIVQRGDERRRSSSRGEKGQAPEHMEMGVNLLRGMSPFLLSSSFCSPCPCRPRSTLSSDCEQEREGSTDDRRRLSCHRIKLRVTKKSCLRVL